MTECQREVRKIIYQYTLLSYHWDSCYFCSLLSLHSPARLLFLLHSALRLFTFVVRHIEGGKHVRLFISTLWFLSSPLWDHSLLSGYSLLLLVEGPCEWNSSRLFFWSCPLNYFHLQQMQHMSAGLFTMHLVCNAEPKLKKMLTFYRRTKYKKLFWILIIFAEINGKFLQMDQWHIKLVSRLGSSQLFFSQWERFLTGHCHFKVLFIAAEKFP